MVGVNFLGIVLSAIHSCEAVKMPNIRGVAPSDLHLYKADDGFFACLGDPSIKIPVDRVNDDYCDCPDGSDEPGTAACRNGKFWCENKGHIGQYIPSYLVGDGACDYSVCCDGSDEAPGVCPDRCAEVHKVYEAELQARAAIRAKGLAVREDLLIEAERKEKEWEESIAEKSRILDETEKKLVEAKAELQTLQIEDAEFGADADVESMQRLADIKQSLQNRHERAEELFNKAKELETAVLDLNAAFDAMASTYNPNFNDPAVKEAIKTWKDITENKQFTVKYFSEDLKEDLERLDQVKVASSSDRSFAGTYNFFQLLRSLVRLLKLEPLLAEISKFARDWNLDIFQEYLDGLSSSTDGTTFDSPRVKAAKTVVRNLEHEISDTNRVITETKHKTSSDWGPDGIGRAVADTCISDNIGEYRYEVCFFGGVTQQGTGQHNSLGSSSGIKQIGDDLRIDFEMGDQCWNGPRRRAEVTIRCGTEHKITAVSEPNKCSYAIDVLSPIACTPAQIDPVHGEHGDL